MPNSNQLIMNLYEACRQEFVLPENVLNLATTNVEVRRIRKINIVDQFLNEYHYLHSGDVFKSIGVITRAYGLYFGGELAGITVYNPPGSKSPAEYLYGTEPAMAYYRQGTLALSRLVVSPEAPFNASGYLIAHSLRQLWDDNIERTKQEKAPYRTVVSYADSALNHTGTVYRAQNAWFAGMAPGKSIGGFYNPLTGHCVNIRQGKRTLTKRDCPLGYRPFPASIKLRYLFFLGDPEHKLETMRKLDPNVKLLTKVGKYSVLKEGRIVGASEPRSYETVYEYFGKRGTDNITARYADYLAKTS